MHWIHPIVMTSTGHMLPTFRSFRAHKHVTRRLEHAWHDSQFESRARWIIGARKFDEYYTKRHVLLLFTRVACFGYKTYNQIRGANNKPHETKYDDWPSMVDIVFYLPKTSHLCHVARPLSTFLPVSIGDTWTYYRSQEIDSQGRCEADWWLWTTSLNVVFTPS